jgi:SNF2 family DNA or RNA helicase
MTPAQEKAYAQMLATGTAELNGSNLNAVGILAILTRLKQFASSHGNVIVHPDGSEEFRPAAPSNKLDWLEQFLMERNIIGDPDEEPTGKVVIVSQFTSLLSLCANKLFADYGLKYARITGAVTGSKRQHEIDRFNDPDSGVNVMFLNTLAGGVAITLDAADDMVFLDETHVPDDQKQAEGRIDNRRPEVKVAQRRYWYLKSLETIDEAIARTNARREADQSWHLDGRRGVEYAREVFATMEEMQAKARGR